MEYSAESPVQRAASVLGHYSGECLIIAIGGMIFARLFPPDGQAGLLVSVLIIALVIGSFLLMRRHDRHLCETCMAEMPLNPSDAANRKRSRLWVAHNGAETKFAIPYLTVVIGSNLAIDVIGPIPWAVIQSTMMYLVLAQVTHRRLQPWCPWCRGGGEEVPTSPDLLPSDDRLNV